MSQADIVYGALLAVSGTLLVAAIARTHQQKIRELRLLTEMMAEMRKREPPPDDHVPPPK